MPKSDEGNLVLADSIESVDQINGQFYGRFPYPRRAFKFDYLEDTSFEPALLCQGLGDWAHRRVPQGPRVWVAGCGTNQAVFTALRFRGGSVIGSDLSRASLEVSAGTARSLGLSNLELRQESINGVGYHEEFDHVISTGVIHHNADPRETLLKIAGALKPGGVLELMVYNKFHWTIPAAFQKAVRLFGADGGAPDFERELTLTRKIIAELPPESSIGSVAKYRDISEAMLADELLQPVLHYYTVESLSEMAESCGLELLLPCLDQFDKEEGKLSWNIEFKDAELRERYDSLPDVQRWQVTNLLLREASPQLWFYLQRKDSGVARKDERDVDEEFLEQVFARTETTQRGFLQTKEGGYKAIQRPLGYPALPPDESVRKFVEAADGRTPMREIFRRLSPAAERAEVHRARLMLTTPQFPYLRAVPHVAS